jgi:hypothetical protein
VPVLEWREPGHVLVLGVVADRLIVLAELDRRPGAMGQLPLDPSGLTPDELSEFDQLRSYGVST